MEKIKAFIILLVFLTSTIELFNQTTVCIEPLDENKNISSKYFEIIKKAIDTNRIFEEDFSNGVPPDGWTIQGIVPNQWCSRFESRAGGTLPEAGFNWSQHDSTTYRLITPLINTTNNNQVAIELYHYLHLSGPSAFSLSIDVRAANSDWNTIWEVFPVSSFSGEILTLLYNDTWNDSQSFQISFTLTGNVSWIIDWRIDNISVFEPYDLDMEVKHFDISQQILLGQFTGPTALIKNQGLLSNACEILLEIKSGSTIIYSVTQNIPNMASFDYDTRTFPSWTPNTTGVYEATIKVISGDDQNPSNDSITKQIHVFEGLQPKKPLFEVFTSSTCPFCYDANIHIDNTLANNPEEYTLVKYQMYWPLEGDLYCTQQGIDRKNYYLIDYVPHLLCNADEIYPIDEFSQAVFDDYAAELTPIQIEMESQITADSIVTITVEIVSNANYYEGLRAHMIVCEKETTGNIGSNGQNEFHNVMMYMHPSSAGYVLPPIVDGDPVFISESFKLDSTNVEEFNDLVSVVAIQNYATKEILQSEMCDISIWGVGQHEMKKQDEVLIYPNPASEKVFVSVPEIITQLKVFNQKGVVMIDKKLSTSDYSFEVRDFAPGLYFIRINTCNRIITKQVSIL